MPGIEQLDPKKFIIIKGARVHNLKNIDVSIPRNSFTVITGLSGSGKSSLAFDTLYAEGQRRYVESLSAYARQFLGRMSKPEVDYIRGISPAVAIEQKTITRNPRSTVGTTTEIYDYLKLLFSRTGKTYSPISGNLVMRHTVTDVTDFILSLQQGSKVLIYAPFIAKKKRTFREQLGVLLQQGFTRIWFEDTIYKVEDVLHQNLKLKGAGPIHVLVDRVEVNETDEDLAVRVQDSVQTAFFEGEGTCLLEYYHNGIHAWKEFSNHFELDGMSFEEPSVNLFTFNNPYGACKTCEGFGSVIGIDEDLVVPDKSLSIYQEAVACWRGEKMSEWKDQLVMNAYKFDFPIHKPFYDLTDEQRNLLWTGNKHFYGLNEFFKYVESQTYKIQYRVMLSRYRGRTICPDCKGTRLRKDANYVKVGGKSVSDLILMPASESLEFFRNLALTESEMAISKRILAEIRNRLQYLNDVGLGYLTLNRTSSTLSGGEAQRINLATSLGSSLVGSMYILDEPSIGLHPRDTHRLIRVLLQLRDMGNTVIVVEHDEEIIRAADHLVDIGPLAGQHGGEVVCQGTCEEVEANPASLTGRYLNKTLAIETPAVRQAWKEFIEVKGARENNLKNLSVKFPLHTLTAVTGVSGSGKTSLVKNILYQALKKHYGGYGDKTGKFDRLEGDVSRIADVELVDQNPIGRSTRSNPATYVKAYDEIRGLFADQKLAKARGYKPGFFSFNIEGGRCEECEGEGIVKIEMQFMADITLVCDSCGGKRFKEEVLDVKYNDRNITDVLDMTVSEAIAFFSAGEKPGATERRIVARLQPLEDVGLGYLRLGQPSSTLSGGEAQRIKLAFFLAKGEAEKPTLFIFDEPTTGLHFHDISKLLKAFRALLEKGHSLVVIEHNLEVIRSADWIIDLGPEGGEEGGNIVTEGTPEEVATCEASFTGRFLLGKSGKSDSLEL